MLYFGGRLSQIPPWVLAVNTTKLLFFEVTINLFTLRKIADTIYTTLESRNARWKRRWVDDDSDCFEAMAGGFLMPCHRRWGEIGIRVGPTE